MKDTLRIVMAPATTNRLLMEEVEGHRFPSEDHVKKALGEPLRILTLSEFQDEFNNDELPVDVSYMTYVYVVPDEHPRVS